MNENKLFISVTDRLTERRNKEGCKEEGVFGREKNAFFFLITDLHMKVSIDSFYNVVTITFVLHYIMYISCNSNKYRRIRNLHLYPYRNSILLFI